MIDWKRKLSSRKFWVAVVGLISGLLLLFGVDNDTTEKIGGIVLTAGSIVGYIIGEGIADAGNVGTDAAEALPDEGDEFDHE